MFADDNQLHNSLNPNSINSPLSAKANIEQCISALSTWLHNNQLKLNENKTELVMIGKNAHLSKLKYNSITIAGEEIHLFSSDHILFPSFAIKQH